MDDVILGDNGEIIREIFNFTSRYPWINGIVWIAYPQPFDGEKIRDVRRYDDIDFVEVSPIGSVSEYLYLGSRYHLRSY